MSLDPDIQDAAGLGQQVLVLQGGGALGAYQVGVYQALDEAGVELDWVVGTSIGAINAAIIAGSPHAERMGRLAEFWSRIEQDHLIDALALPSTSAVVRNWLAAFVGVPGFFEPNGRAFLSPSAPLPCEEAGYYSVEPLKRTLADLIDFELLARAGTRLTVGASDVTSGEMTYFDSRDTRLDLRHILASGALPPAFPPVRIDDGLYWDGGILSNTPVEVVFDDRPRRDSMVYAVHLWNPEGHEPRSMREVLNRTKDVQYASRSAVHIARQRQLHELRHVITRLADLIPEPLSQDPEVRALAEYGCRTRMHVVRLLAPRLDGEDQNKDLDFSASGIRRRWEAGFAHTMRVLETAPWRGESDPLEGFVLHEAVAGEPTWAA
jgi:NTE family protein